MQPHEFWQDIEPPEAAAPAPWKERYPARLPDGRTLHLPIRALGDGGEGIASLILNQASFAVEAALADALADALRPAAPEVIAGLPTLGLSLARAVAERLGHRRFVALGTSRKFWYDEALSTPLSSITSPDATKRLYLDPRMRPLLEGRRVGLVDDVISTGTSISAGLRVLALIGVAPVVVGAAMLQTDRWRAQLSALKPPMADRVRGVLRTPKLLHSNEGWRPAQPAA